MDNTSAKTKTIISSGRFRLGQKSKEMNQAYKGQYATRSAWVNGKHIWPSYEIQSVDSTLNFSPSDDSHYKNGSTYTGKNRNPIDEFQMDPSGGTIEVNVISRESSLWHCLKFIVGAKPTKNNSAIKSILTPASLTAYTPGVGDEQVIDVTDETACKNAGLNPEDFESFYRTSPEYERCWLVNMNQTANLPVQNSSHNTKLTFNIGSNNTSTPFGCGIYIIGFLDEFDKPILLIDEDKRVTLAKWSQNPNAIYKVQMNWVDGQNSSVVLDPNSTQTIDYNQTNAQIYWLCIDLGVSLDGGTTYQWNQGLSENPDLYKYVTVSLGGDDKDKFDVSVATTSGYWVQIKLTPKYTNDNANVNDENKTTEYMLESRLSNDYLEFSGVGGPAIYEGKHYSDSVNHNSNIALALKNYTQCTPWNVEIHATFAGKDSLVNFKGEI